MEIGSFEVVSKTFIMKRIYRNEAFRGMQGNGLNGRLNKSFTFSWNKINSNKFYELLIPNPLKSSIV
jgi:hypothetical protein